MRCNEIMKFGCASDQKLVDRLTKDIHRYDLMLVEYRSLCNTEICKCEILL